MKCHDVEKLLINNQMTKEANQHIESCESCQLYRSLLLTETINISVNKNVDQIVTEGLRKKKFMDMLSFVGFLIVLIMILSSIYQFGNIKYYILIQGVFTVIMPITALIITIIRRKEYKHE